MSKNRSSIGNMDGAEFRDALLTLGISQPAFAHLLGVPMRTIAHWVAHKPPAAGEVITRLYLARPELIGVTREVMQRPERVLQKVGRKPKVEAS